MIFIKRTAHFQRLKKQGPAGQRCVREAHEAHEAHEANEAHEAHEAHLAHPAHTAISMLDWPDDFHRDNSSFSAFEKKRVTIRQTDRQTDGRTHPHIEMRGRI